VDGKPHISPNKGYAIARMKYDDHGNMVEKAYFGENGKLRSTPDGYAIERMKYDEQGKQVETAFFGPDDALTSSWEGFAIVARQSGIVVFDETRHVEARCLNGDIDGVWISAKECSVADGRPVIVHPVISEVFRSSRALELGLQIGDVIEAYDGKPVSSARELADLVKQPGEKKRRIDLLRRGRRLMFEAPPGLLGISLGMAFVPTGQSPAESAGK
jgi:hypothetical protein